MGKRQTDRHEPNTAVVRRLERQFGKPLPVLLSELYYAREWRQVQIAAYLGVAQSTVSGWFRRYGLLARRAQWVLPPAPAPLPLDTEAPS